MDSKNFTAPIIFVFIGVLLGWFIWAGPNNKSNSENEVMSDVSHDMSMTIQEMNTDLVGKTGESFDRAFIDLMIVHHEGAIEAANMALHNAGHEELQNLAKDVIIAQTFEIEKMKVWQREWFNKN